VRQACYRLFQFLESPSITETAVNISVAKPIKGTITPVVGCRFSLALAQAALVANTHDKLSPASNQTPMTASKMSVSNFSGDQS